MATRTGADTPRPEFDTLIEEEAAALLAEAGLVLETAPAVKKARVKKASPEKAPELEQTPELAIAPAPRKARTRAVSLEDLETVEETPAVVRKPRKKATDVQVEEVASDAEAMPLEAAPAKKPRVSKSAPAVEPEVAMVADASAAPDVAVVATEAPLAEPETAVVAEALAGEPEVAVVADTATAAKPEREQSDRASDGPTFAALGLSDVILKSIKDVGYEAPSPIQQITIPAMLRGVDVIAQAQTGSGKTAAFGLPIIDKLDGRDRHIQALILTPTRELAIQVAEALHKYGKQTSIETLPIYGGQPYERQFRGLQRGPQIVVGTPGRVMDHMRRGTLNLDNLRYFVLDEADEMLDMGFIEDIEWVLEHAPDERQTALFSATMPPRIVDLSRRYLHDPERLVVPGKQMTVPATRQTYYEVPRSRKIDALTRILDAETPPLAMIFCRTKHGVDELGEALMARGFGAETLHGDLSQTQRDRVMKRFRSGQADILVATDVAARGLDIDDVSHVFNFDIPESPEAYVHRIGRTGRAGKTGEAVTLVTPKEVRWLKQIERIVKARIEPRRLPTAADVADRRREALRMLIVEILENEEGYATYLDTVGSLAEEHDLAEVAAALLKLYADETGKGISTDQKDDDLAILTAATGGRGEQGMVRLFLNIGRNFGVRPQDIVGAIANEAGISGRAIGAIDILDTYTFVDIPNQFADQVIEALRRSGIKGRPVNAERAQGESPRTGRFDDGGRPPRRDFNRSGSSPRPQGGPRRPRQGGGDQGNSRDSRGPSTYQGQRRPGGNRRSDW